MTAPGLSDSPLRAYGRALVAAGDKFPSLSVVEARASAEAAPSAFAQRFPDRCTRVSLHDRQAVDAASLRSEGAGPVFLDGPVAFLVETAYPVLARTLVAPRRNVKLVGLDGGTPAGGGHPPSTVRNDLAAMRTLPAMTVVAPADAPTTHTAVLALAERAGPAYLRVPAPDAPVATDGTFAVGKAHELRGGVDLTVVALGPTLPRALLLADELGRVGVSARVLDVASVKPFDEGAILRAARDTGAILVLEAAPLGDGVGTLVAALTAENHPVPMRRLGYPDVWQDADESLLSPERVRDEAFELLRLRGKIT